MKLVVGLGNPGRRYRKTRHNVGFRVAERFADDHGIRIREKRFDGRFGRGRLSGLDVGVLLPRTFMNLSGDSVGGAVAELGVADVPNDLLVIVDDVDLPFGRLRLRAAGSAGGHKGLLDVERALGHLSYARLRFGVGRPIGRSDTADYVLESFSRAEEKVLYPLVERAAQAVAIALYEGIAPAMNRYNRDPEEEAPTDTPKGP